MWCGAWPRFRGGSGRSRPGRRRRRRCAVTTVTDAGERTVQAQGFRFAPRPTRGLLLGLHLGQLLLIGMGAAAFVVGLSRGVVGAVLGVLTAAACVAVAVVPTRSGTRVDLLAVAIARHVLRKLA